VSTFFLDTRCKVSRIRIPRSTKTALNPVSEARRQPSPARERAHIERTHRLSQNKRWRYIYVPAVRRGFSPQSGCDDARESPRKRKKCQRLSLFTPQRRSTQTFEGIAKHEANKAVFAIYSYNIFIYARPDVKNFACPKELRTKACLTLVVTSSWPGPCDLLLATNCSLNSLKVLLEGALQ
jgi:hypothetical protein